MKLRHTAIAAVLALTALPFTSQATTDRPQAAVNACVKAFVQTYLSDYQVRETKKILRATNSPIEAYYQARKYSVALTARGLQSGDLIAQAHCVANGNGIVLVLDTPADPAVMARTDFVVSVR
jgi:hypothetical protein